VQQYEFIKFTVVLQEDLFGQNRILKHLELLYYYGFVHWTFFFWAVKKGSVHKNTLPAWKNSKKTFKGAVSATLAEACLVSEPTG